MSFDDGRAAFDPVAAIQIADAIDHAVGRVVDVATNDAIDLAAMPLGRNHVLELSDEVDGAFDAILEIRREGPISEPKAPTHPSSADS